MKIFSSITGEMIEVSETVQVTVIEIKGPNGLTIVPPMDSLESKTPHSETESPPGRDSRNRDPPH